MNISWTKEDIQLLIKTAYELRTTDPEPSLLQIIKIAQEIIPEERRKVIVGKNNCLEIINGVKSFFRSEPKREEIVPLIIKDNFGEKLEKLAERVSRLETIIKKNRPKIALVGFLGEQYNHIKEEIGNEVSLTFVETNKNKNVKLPAGDYCIYSSFVDHATSNRCNELYGTQNTYRIDGAGRETTIKKIREILNHD